MNAQSGYYEISESYMRQTYAAFAVHDTPLHMLLKYAHAHLSYFFTSLASDLAPGPRCHVMYRECGVP